jgi:hypothetical protein
LLDDNYISNDTKIEGDDNYDDNDDVVDDVDNNIYMLIIIKLMVVMMI